MPTIDDKPPQFFNVSSPLLKILYFRTDFQIKGGDTRRIEFSKTGSSRLTVSPSKGTFTVAAGIGKTEH